MKSAVPNAPVSIKRSQNPVDRDLTDVLDPLLRDSPKLLELAVPSAENHAAQAMMRTSRLLQIPRLPQVCWIWLLLPCAIRPHFADTDTLTLFYSCCGRKDKCSVASEERNSAC